MIDKRVDRAGPAKDLAPRMIDFPAPEIRFGIAAVHPVDGALVEQDSVTDWHANPETPVGRACLKQQNRVSTACRQSFRQNTAGRSAADNDVIKFLHPLPPSQDIILCSS